MPITRKFLGLGRPPLHLAADYLLERYAQAEMVDMSRAIVVLPGRRAGRRLLEILVQRTEEQPFTPPQIETVGHLPECLYQPQLPFATDLVQQLAWARVLGAASSDDLGEIVAHAPAKDRKFDWLELGRLIGGLHSELAADRLDFACVVQRLAGMQAHGELARWQSLQRLQANYLALLDGLKLWDIQTARLEAIKRHECRTDKDIIVAGTVDMNVTQRQMLDQVADRVTALVFAPDAWRDRFDGHGCLTPDRWQEIEIELDMARVHVVEGPTEQADRVARCLAAYEGRFRADEITIGLADEKITPFIQRQIAQMNLHSRSAAGIQLAEMPIYRLLGGLAAYLQSESYPEFAALVRHPDVSQWIASQPIAASWLEDLDNYQNKHLVARFADRSGQTNSTTDAVRQVVDRIHGLLAPLRGPAQPLDRWLPLLRQLLLQIYEHRVWDRDQPLDRLALRTFEQVHEVWEEYAERIPPALLPSMTAADTLLLTLSALRSKVVSPAADPEAIEMMGWLELPWDDAPALIVTSVNESYVPSSVNADMFLPDALRRHLELQDNTRRYARDAYALQLLLATRSSVDLILARHNSEDDPLIPSRLLLACDPAVLPQHARKLFGTPQSLHDLPPLAGRLSASSEQAAFVIPRPEPLAEPIRELSITAFRDYLACPYRFYLRRVLHLQSVDDAAEELDGGMFGGLLHEVLREFGEGRYRDSTNPDEIRAVLREALEQRVVESFGEHPLASVRVQTEQLRMRLDAFAEKQAAWAAAGWRIKHTEVPDYGHQGAILDVDGEPLILRGRIDRIDENSATREHIILDYKSSDAGRPPEKVHQQRDEWIDLQLPLYRHLARSLAIPEPVRLGYILLPKEIGKTEFRLAPWTEAELAEADDVARDVVRNIRQENFWPPTDPPPDFSEEFATICQDGIFERGNSL